MFPPGRLGTSTQHGVSPVLSLHFPAPHNVHSVLSLLAYLPAPQASHVVPGLVLTLPAVQSTQTRAPTAPDICLPASHSVQTVCPVSLFVYLLAGQLSQLDSRLASGLDVSLGQGVQSLGSSFPVLAEKVPGGQSLQPVSACTPVADEYVPAGQAWHVDSALAFPPVLSLHFPAPHNVHSVLSLLAYLPAPQASHVVPGLVLTLPAVQSTQTRAPTAPDICLPASHSVQTVCPVSLFVYLLAGQLSQLDSRLASGLDVSLGQGVQSLGSSFPVLAEKVPGGQSLQPVSACTPVADEYVPAGQAWHVVSALAFPPVLSLHFPAPHNVHSVLSLLAYLPAPQASHVVPGLVLTLPAVQSTQTRAPTAPDICLPASHSVQTVCPVSLFVYLLAGQLSQLDSRLASGLDVSLGQGVQSLGSSFPVLAEKVPGGQSLQPVSACTPVADEYVPAGQAWHVDSALAFPPVLSLHFPAPHNVHSVLSLLAYLPAPQASHVVPGLVLTLPAVQSTQTRAPTAPDICLPASHSVQTVCPVSLFVYLLAGQLSQLDSRLASGLDVSLGQGVQSLGSSFPVLAEKVPGGQSLQPVSACTPVADEYVPAGQAWHVDSALAFPPVLSLHFPAPHNVHSVLSLLAYLPAPQASHVVPGLVLTLPAVQSTQTRAPTAPDICLPASHSVQTVCPVSLFVYLLAGQLSQLDSRLASGLDVSLGQGVQSLGSSFPVLAEKVPGGQSLQPVSACTPVADEYVPAGQAWHVDSALAFPPVLSLHFPAPHNVHSVLSLLAYLPAPQASHVVPGLVLTLPAVQSTQTRAPTAPDICLPASHSVQTVCPVSLFVYLLAGQLSQLDSRLASGLDVSLGQGVQSLGSSFPVLAEKVPGGQSLQPVSACTPVADEYVPAGQAWHVDSALAFPPVLSLHFPAPHNVHSVLSLLAYLPAPQASHVVPGLVLTLPAVQSTQTRAPTAPDICLPASHSVQTVCPVSLFVYLLAGQLSQLDSRLASGLDVSLGQGVQSLGSSFPVLAEKVPGGQSLQPVSACTPVADEYVPAGQAWHVDSALAFPPVLSLHFPAPHNVHSVLSLLAYLPAPQASHVVPGLVLTLPAVQSTQTRAPTAPDICLPASHSVQTVCPVSLFVYLLAGQLSQLDSRLASGLDVSLGQGVQSLGSSFPVLAEKVPGGQSLQPVSACTPVADEYVPAGQAWHVDSALAFPPVLSLHFPAPHNVHSVLSLVGVLARTTSSRTSAPGLVLTLPAAQSIQTRAPMAPDICLPASHSVQTVCPVALFVNFPMSQSSQFVFSGCALNLSCPQSLQLLFCPVSSS